MVRQNKLLTTSGTAKSTFNTFGLPDGHFNPCKASRAVFASSSDESYNEYKNSNQRFVVLRRAVMAMDSWLSGKDNSS